MSSLLESVSILFLVVMFDTGEGQLIDIIETPQSLFISLYGEYIERGGTTNNCVGGWVGPVFMVVFVETADAFSHNHCLGILWSK